MYHLKEQFKNIDLPARSEKINLIQTSQTTQNGGVVCVCVRSKSEYQLPASC